MRSEGERRVRDLERIRYVAANYDHLQGLRKLPLGIFLLALVSAVVLSRVWAATRGDVVPVPALLGIVAVIFSLFVAGISLPLFITRYYERRYGTVKRYRPTPTKRSVLYLTMILALLLGGSLPLLVMGVAMLVAYWSDRRFQWHYVILGVLAIGGALVHVANAVVQIATGEWMWITGQAMPDLPQTLILVTVASYLIVGGVLDHLLLVGIMKTTSEEDGARAV